MGKCSKIRPSRAGGVSELYTISYVAIQAAEALHVSASAIDRQILQAEKLLDTPLFERLPTGLKLTVAGEMPIDQPLAGRARLSLSTALDYRHLISAAPLIVHERAQRLYARHSLAHGHAVICNNVSMMRALICDGVGIGILSFLDVAVEVAQNPMAFVRLHGKSVTPLVLALCVAPRRQLSRAAALVMRRVAQALPSVGI